MKEEELEWTTWYAWYPVLLVDTHKWAWRREVERAFDPGFIQCYVPYSTIGTHYYRTKQSNENL